MSNRTYISIVVRQSQFVGESQVTAENDEPAHPELTLCTASDFNQDEQAAVATSQKPGGI